MDMDNSVVTAGGRGDVRGLNGNGKKIQQRLKEITQPWLQLSGLSVGCEQKGCRFNTQSGHMPGLRARFPAGGAQEATTH